MKTIIVCGDNLKHRLRNKPLYAQVSVLHRQISSLVNSSTKYIILLLLPSIFDAIDGDDINLKVCVCVGVRIITRVVRINVT